MLMAVIMQEETRAGPVAPGSPIPCTSMHRDTAGPRGADVRGAGCWGRCTQAEHLPAEAQLLSGAWAAPTSIALVPG